MTTLDVLVVGAGFSGCYLLDKLRSHGFSVKLCEASDDLGGVWSRNRYPGLRVDVAVPVYQYSDEMLWKDWTWTEKYPTGSEIREYFHYVDGKLNLSKDIYLNTRVTAAEFDVHSNQWEVKTTRGTFKARFVVMATGSASQEYIPNFKGLDSFKGFCCHTAKWPHEGVDLANKRVGVIGTGGSGVQVIQKLAPIASHLTVFQRTPDLALPMLQQKYSRDEIEMLKKTQYDILLRRRNETDTGADLTFTDKKASDASASERQRFYEDQWAKGGFEFWVGNYHDILTDRTINDEIYQFWRSRVTPRIHDPIVREKLAPATPPHPFGLKRPSLEQGYFEVFNRSNVTLVDIKDNAISEITPTGLTLANGEEYELDALILATGYDGITGAITSVDLRGVDGLSIRDKWSNGAYTHLGFMTNGFPNCYFTCAVQAPSAFCNAPTCSELQGDWIVANLLHMREKGFTRIEATRAAEESWRAFVNAIGDATLFKEPKTSWYTGSNIPGKPVEHLMFLGGLQLYLQRLRESTDKGYEGFVFA